MKLYVNLFICFTQLVVLSACKNEGGTSTTAEPLAIIETAIPNGLIPGSALTLKGKNFLTVSSVKFANTSVPASAFIRTSANELSLKVPVGSSAGKICIVNQNGQGEWKDMSLITSGVLTADNVGAQGINLVQGNYSDVCSPSWFVYCYNGSCLIYLRGSGNQPVGAPSGTPPCTKYYTIEEISGASYEVYTHPKATLKFELQKGSPGYTGLVIMEVNGVTYLGSAVKNAFGGSLVGYSTIDGQLLKLCNPFPSGFGYGQPSSICAQSTPCTSCR